MKRFAILLAILLPLAIPSLRAEELPGRYEITEKLPDGYETPIQRRGRVEEFKYSTPGGEKSALVYLPYGYDAFYSHVNDGAIRAYPFFYLMHGGGEDQTCYFSKDGPSPLSNILDRLIDEGKLAPIIVVAPSFYPKDRDAVGFDELGNLTRNFPEELTRDLMPAVEKKYRSFAGNATDEELKATRATRGFGGFSMGAETTWNVFLQKQDYFRYFVPISGDSWIIERRGGQTASEKTAEKLAESIKAQGKNPRSFEIYAVTGREDIAYEPMNALVEAMAKRDEFRFGINLFYGLKPNGKHWHGDVRLYLYKILPHIWPGKEEEAKPLLAYDFEETRDGRIADLSGNGFDAELVGEGARLGEGRVGKGLVLNETADDGYLRLPEGFLKTATDATFLVWIKLQSFVSYERVFDFGFDENVNMYLTPTTTDGAAGKMQLAITKGSTRGEQLISVPTEFKLNEWTRVAAVKRGDSFELYLNGRLVGRQTGVTLAIDETVGDGGANYLGKSQYAHDKNLRATLDGFAVYKRALSQAEILRDVAASVGGYAKVDEFVIETPLGETPDLPETVTAVDKTGVRIESAVYWGEPRKLYSADSYELKGNVGDEKLYAKAQIVPLSDSTDERFAIRAFATTRTKFDTRQIVSRFIVVARVGLFHKLVLKTEAVDEKTGETTPLRVREVTVRNGMRFDEMHYIDVRSEFKKVRLSVYDENGTLVSKPFEFEPRFSRSGSFLPDEDVSLLPGMFQKMRDDNARNLLQLDLDRLLAAHRAAAGLPAKAERYGGWESWDSSGFGIGHWLSAACLMYRKTNDPEYLRKLDYVVDELAQTARPSGFIGGIDEKRVIANIFDRPDSFQVDAASLGGIWDCFYGIQKVFKGLVEVYQTTGNEKALELAKGFAQWLWIQTGRFNHAQQQRMLFSEHGAVGETALWLYDITGESYCLQLAQRFLRDDLLDPLSEGKDNLTGRHVNEHVPEVESAAAFYEYTGDGKYRRAAEFFWQTCRKNRMYANSGMGLSEHFTAPDAEPLGSTNCETCCNFNMMKLTEILFSWDRRVEYVDYLEESLFNLIYPSQDQDNSEGYGKTYFSSFVPGSYRFFSTRDDSFWCCCLGGMENPARLDKAIYFKDGDALYVNLFIPSTARLSDCGLALRQETRFPYESATKLTVTEGEARRALKIRVPGWLAGEMTVDVNGERTAAEIIDGYATVCRTWRQGDVVEIALPMALNLYKSREKGQVAFKYGPILLAAVLDEVEESERYSTNNNKLGGFKGIPVPNLLVSPDESPERYLETVDREKLEFRLGPTATEDGSTYTLRPFFELNRHRYIVYWPTKE